MAKSKKEVILSLNKKAPLLLGEAGVRFPP